MMSTSAVSSQVAAAPSSGSGIWAGIPTDASFSPWFIAIDSKDDLFALDASGTIVERQAGSTTWNDITNVGFLDSQRSNLINTEYNFYVKPEDEGRAYKALQNR